MPWDGTRVGLVQELWGPGFERPGGPESVLDMLKPCGVDPAMSILELGAGLGGATRTLCREFEVWIRGLEPDTQLQAFGQELSEIAGLAKRAVITGGSLERPALKRRSLDLVFARQAFMTVADKPKLLEAIVEALKPRGQLMMTDYVIDRTRTGLPEVELWRSGEPVEPHPWSATRYVEQLDELGVDIRITEDCSETHIQSIRQGWARFLDEVTHRGTLEPYAKILMKEAELWNRRLKALECGGLRVYRFHAFKPGDRTLSDW